MQDNYPWRSTEALARKPGDRVQANQQGSSSLPRRKPSALSQRGVRLLTHDAMSHLLHIGRSLMPRRTPLALRRQARGPRLLLVEGRLAPLEQARRPRARLRCRGRLAPRALRARAPALNPAGAGTRGPAPEALARKPRQGPPAGERGRCLPAKMRSIYFTSRQRADPSPPHSP